MSRMVTCIYIQVRTYMPLTFLNFLFGPSVTATQSRYEHGITCMQTYIIGMSMDADIKIRSRRRWKKGHVYIHSAESVSEPLTRLPCPCNAVISVFRNGAVTPITS